MTNTVTTFKEDFRENNPGLHCLYLKWAIEHLHTINKMIVELNNFGNTNTMAVAYAILKEKEKLIGENAAYSEANELLLKLKLCS